MSAIQPTPGFTLIELSIVLVIIGLLAGGVLVGADLIRSSEVRAQISQIEKYNTAVNTFRGKFGALPGDLNNAVASQFGFTPRGGIPGTGDGNGLLEGSEGGPSGNFGAASCGENLMFWVDLTTANGRNVNLVDGGFSAYKDITAPPGSAIPDVTNTADFAKLIPSASIGRGNFIYSYSGTGGNIGNAYANDGQNYFGLSAVFNFDEDNDCDPGSQATLTVAQAYQMDKKADDGMPQSGRITARFVDYGFCFGVVWAGTSCNSGISPFNTATAGNAQSCFDNSASASGAPGITGAPQHYSMEINNGANPNCAVSFQFQ